jgi:uncharacterized protein (DUF1330 family)
MAAYMIFRHKVLDSDTLNNEYLPKALATLAAYEPEVLVADEHIEVFEGHTDDTRTVVLKFKDKETAKRWYNSPEYQKVVGIRLGVTDGAAVLCEGFVPPE